MWTASPNDAFRAAVFLFFKVFPFVHTFPAYDESRRTWVESSCKRCPETAAILRRLPNIRTALFSRLGGGSRISGHRGWADLANHVLRCHLPIKVPSDGVCGLWVESEVRVMRRFDFARIFLPDFFTCLAEKNFERRGRRELGTTSIADVRIQAASGCGAFFSRLFCVWKFLPLRYGLSRQ